MSGSLRARLANRLRFIAACGAHGSRNLGGKGKRMKAIKAIRWTTSTLAVILLFCTASAFAQTMHTSSQFQGPKTNKGTVTSSQRDGKLVLTLSEDFVVPDTPDPHWELVDSNGTVYLLNKLKVKGLVSDKVNKEITVPAYVKNVSKVVIWCAYAEVNLGEASFSSPVM